MKTFSLLGLTFLASLACGQEDPLCEACLPEPSTFEVVTLEPKPEPTIPCETTPLVTVPVGTGGMPPIPTELPPVVAGAPGKGLYMGASGVMALVMGVVLLM
ncbi:hypothetical protein E4U55_000454 [Claviceps digitariae]|nr:hypothetical protein E4U55_000454 [Claviceps digitariae]